MFLFKPKHVTDSSIAILVMANWHQLGFLQVWG